MKMAGHRVGTIEVENVIISRPAVAEAKVCGVLDEISGEVAAAFAVLKTGFLLSEELKRGVIEHVRKNLGPTVVFRDVQFVNMLFKTRSGKIMRKVMERLFFSQDLGDLSTLKEKASVEGICEAVEKIKNLLNFLFKYIFISYTLYF